MADAQIDKLSKELYKNQSSLNPALFGDDEDDLFRPTLADNVKVGYFNLDRACQTHESDVIPLKEMTVVLQDLTKDAVTIKRDIHLTRKKLETDYETRLQDKTFALYSRINEKLKELEATHVERVGIVRKAYRQQLADALARVETLFQSRFEKQMERDREKHKVELSKLQGQVSNLTQTIQRNESVIIMLKKQLASKQKVEEELQALRSKVRTRIPLPSLDIGIQCLLGTVVHEDEPPEGAVISQQNEQSQEPPPREDTTKIDALTKQLEDVKEQLKAKDREIGTLEDELDNKNAEINATVDRCNRLQNELEKEAILKSQLSAELSDVKNQASKSSEEAKRLLEKQRIEMEREAAERAEKAREEALGSNAQRMREIQTEFAQRISAMAKEKEELEKEILKERAKNLATPPKPKEEPITDVERLAKSEKELRIHCEKLKKEIERLNKAWEKKFSILQASLYALKDESYLRQHLEKQHTTLHQATITYMTDSPKQRRSRPSVLPGIPNRAPSPDPLASYSVSRASNRQVLENQIGSDSEDENDVVFGMTQLPKTLPPRFESAV